MAYLSERTAKRVTLATDAAYWVELINEFQWRETKQFTRSNDRENIDFVSSADKILLMAIVSWNLDLPDGTIAPITQENIDKLEQDDVLLILRELNMEADSASKKNSSKQ